MAILVSNKNIIFVYLGRRIGKSKKINKKIIKAISRLNQATKRKDQQDAN